MNFFGGGEEAKPAGPDPVFAGKSDRTGQDKTELVRSGRYAQQLYMHCTVHWLSWSILLLMTMTMLLLLLLPMMVMVMMMLVIGPPAYAYFVIQSSDRTRCIKIYDNM